MHAATHIITHINIYSFPRSKSFSRQWIQYLEISSNLSLPQTSFVKYVQCSLHDNIIILCCLFNLRSEQMASIASSQMPAPHYLQSPGGAAAYVMPHRSMYSQVAATPGLLPQCEFITPFVSSCNIAFKSLAGLSSFSYGYQPPHLTPSMSSWPQSKSTMQAWYFPCKVACNST